MGYSSASEARQARESLGKALEALQEDADIPEEVRGMTQNVAKSIGALFEAEYASTEPDGKTCVKNALGTLSQTLALLQDVKSEHAGVQTATESIADVISILFPLTNKPSVRPGSQRPPSQRPPRRHPPTARRCRPPSASTCAANPCAVRSKRCGRPCRPSASPAATTTCTA